MGHGSIDAVDRVEMFAVLYAIAFFVFLGCAFMQMRQGWSTRSEQPRAIRVVRDCTGLKTIHPELLDEHGQLIKAPWCGLI